MILDQRTRPLVWVRPIRWDGGANAKLLASVQAVGTAARWLTDPWIVVRWVIEQNAPISVGHFPRDRRF